MKNKVIYEVSLTGDGRNYFTLYRHNIIAGTGYFSSFIKNLSIDFEKAKIEARNIAGEDEDTETYSKVLILDPDQARQILRGDDVIRFGKYNGRKIGDVFESDKKYVEWVAKGGPVTDRKTGEWIGLIGEENPLRGHAIGLLVGSGDWIERNGKMMPVKKAEFLDYMDALKANPNIKDKERVKGLAVKLVGQVFKNDTQWGSSLSFKVVDENDYVYHANISTGGFWPEPGAWYVIDFSANLYKDRVYMKRVKVQVEPFGIDYHSLRHLETVLYHKNDRGKASAEEVRNLGLIGDLLDKIEDREKNISKSA